MLKEKKMRGIMQQSVNNVDSNNNSNDTNTDQLYGANGGFISPQARTIENQSSISVADQIHIDATSFCDVEMKSQVMDAMISMFR